MCGIIAVYCLRGVKVGLDQQRLRLARDTMRSRGPDASGLWVNKDETIGLGHRRLSIIDLEEVSNQPFISSDGNLILVFNGEIYNYIELRNELKQQGYIFRTNSDTEVLLALYQIYGRNCLSKLRGMFAFVIYDNKTQSIFAARDHFGIKPLYYFYDGRQLIFASQLKAILVYLDKSPPIRASSQVAFFMTGSIPEPHTLFEGINLLEAGQSLEYTPERHLNINTYYKYSDHVRSVLNNQSTYESGDSIHDTLQQVLGDSVRMHFRSDVTMGVFLSSGIDSSLLLGLLHDLGHSKVPTVTLGFSEYKNTNHDETIYIDAIAKQYDAKTHIKHVDHNEFQNEKIDFLSAMDQPTVDGINTFLVSKAAKEQGLKVMLSGLGGDEIFGSYASFSDVPKLVKRLGGLGKIKPLSELFCFLTRGIFSRFSSPKYAGIFSYATSYERAFFLRRAVYMPWELKYILPSKVVKSGLEELELFDAWKNRIKHIDNEHMICSVLETVSYMRNQLLRDADWAGMAHSVEVRVPLVDVVLWDALLPIIKHHALQKSQIADVLETPLPKRIASKSKSGFNVPVDGWIPQSRKKVMNRGVRGWSRYVYDWYTNNVC